MCNLVELIKRWSVAELFTIFENQVYSHQKNLIFAINFVTFLALKLIQHVMAIGSIKYRFILCHKFGDISSIKVDSTCKSYLVN